MTDVQNPTAADYRRAAANRDGAPHRAWAADVVARNAARAPAPLARWASPAPVRPRLPLLQPFCTGLGFSL
jgi:hypothetical protein